MRQLHVVALSQDGRYVLLGTGKNATEATFRVPLEGRLTAAVRGELPRPGQSAPPVAALTPKDMQARLRAGETVEEIARSAGVPVARVERFAGPVEGEKARVVEAARAAVLHRARRGASAVPLGEAVDHHLAETSQLDPGSVEWNARKLEDGSWVVQLSYSVRGRKRNAAWRYTPSTRDLASHDASSSVLGFVDPDERAKAVVAAVTPTRRKRASARAPRSAAAVAAPAAAKGPVKRKVAAKRKVAPKPTVEQAPTPGRTTTVLPAPAARVQPPAAVKRPPAAKARPVAPPAPPAPAVEPAPPPVPESPPQLRVVPPPPEEKKGRAVVPGWADVLLSTTPPARKAAPGQDGE